MQARHKGATQHVAAARAGMSERTARRYERAGKLPSELKRPRTWRTRPNPFEEDWPWVVAELKRDPALQGTTLFALLCERHPQRYQPIQVRTLQRHIAQWKALHGSEQDVIFEQRHIPGERGQSDFTHMDDLGVTLGSVPSPTCCSISYSRTPMWRRSRSVLAKVSRRSPKDWSVACGRWEERPSSTAPII